MSFSYTTLRGQLSRPLLDYSREERFELLTLVCLLGYVCVAEIRAKLGGQADPIYLELYSGFFPYAILGCGIILLGPLEARARLAILGAAGAVTLLRLGFHPSPLKAAEALYGHVLLALTAVAQVSFLIAGSPDRRAERRRALIRGELLLFGVLVGGLSFNALAQLNPTYDAALFNLDQRLLIRIPSVAMHMVDAAPPLRSSISVVYANVPTIVALFDVLSSRRRRGSSMTLIFLLSSYLGFLCYHVVPAAGPPVLVPSYYHRDWSTGLLLPSAASVLGVGMARNCVPSLHAAWAYLFLLNLRCVERAIGRLVIGAAALITILAALTVGEHWFIDLILALPFAMSVNALVGRLSWSSKPQPLLSLAGAVVVAVWFWAIMTNSFARLPSEVVWIAVTATALSPVILTRIFRRLNVTPPTETDGQQESAAVRALTPNRRGRRAV